MDLEAMLGNEVGEQREDVALELCGSKLGREQRRGVLNVGVQSQSYIVGDSMTSRQCSSVSSQVVFDSSSVILPHSYHENGLNSMNY